MMAGMLAGCLGVLALPPFELPGVGAIWLVPWCFGLHGKRRQRMLAGLFTGGLPALHVVAAGFFAEPALALVSIALITLPFVLSAGLAGSAHPARSPAVILMTLGLFCALLAASRAFGMPVSVSLFTTPTSLLAPLISTLGITLTDAVLVSLQWGVYCAIQSRLMPGVVAGLGFILGASGLMIQAKPDQLASHGFTDVALIQTATHPSFTDVLGADGVVERLNNQRKALRQSAEALEPDWVAWPEDLHVSHRGSASMPTQKNALAKTENRRSTDTPMHLRHVYRYTQPGQIRSLVQASSGAAARVVAEKTQPLLFAERYLQASATTDPPVVITKARIGVLICSAALWPKAFKRLRAQGANIVFIPSNSGYWSGRALPALHRKASALYAVAAGLPAVIASNGGSSAVIDLDGQIRQPLPPYQPGVARVRIALGPTPPPSRWSMLGFVGIGIGFGGLIFGARQPIRPAAVTPRCVNGLAIGLMAVLIGAYSPVVSLFGPMRSSPPLPAPIELSGVIAPKPGHRGAVALMLREWGVAIDAKEIPADWNEAQRLLCAHTGLKLAEVGFHASSAPAFGLLRADQAWHAVKWSKAQGVMRFDAQHSSINALDAAVMPHVRWLHQPAQGTDCR